MNVTLYGAASEKIDRVYIDAVEELGQVLAARGHTLVFGGGGTGLMGAAARGFARAGGEIIGVTPRFMHEREPVCDFCTELIQTSTMAERKDVMEEKADAFIIVPGGIGTFDEFFQILTLRALGRHNKPILLYNINGFWDGMLAVIGSDIFKGFISPEVATSFAICETPASVCQHIEGTV